jgi:hypothetical protein
LIFGVEPWLTPPAEKDSTKPVLFCTTPVVLLIENASFHKKLFLWVAARKMRASRINARTFSTTG